ncbi:amidohydrolase [Marinomonas profundimaris]|uniref:Peptidase M20 n=1 Tax=Marinomonas profundimaris TaxID=1208321 RepID=W1RR79_9GAMM|nr:amidohydrolase [Marinomonas profundimaris]ETI59200.1 peptidase M20 [Marinomonas profundimaris]
MLSIDELIALRKNLHQHPELSNQEQETAARILNEFQAFSPDEVVTGLGGTGLAFVFNGVDNGPTTLIRSELDALPIEESNTFSHRSQVKGVSHKCGHDGHMSIVTALGAELAAHRPQKGRVVLCFQPAEETGMGAIQVVNDARFTALKPDYAFALHNYPGLELGKVAVRAGTFNCASRGMIVHLKGKTSHAAHPENGISPANAMCQIIQELNHLPAKLAQQGVEGRHWVTVIHAKLGEIAFGTAPGDAVVMVTLRSESNEGMHTLIAQAEAFSCRLAEQEGLSISFEYDDVFQASVNSQKGHDLVVRACESTQTDFVLLDEPMRWSEDFGQFTATAKEGAMFALGSGQSSPQLHNPDYDFPDALIPIGKTLFLNIIRQINGTHSVNSTDP